MASAFPHQTPVDHTPREQTDFVVTRDEPTDVLQTLSSETAQEILSLLRAEPATASDLAEDLDKSLQNVEYHLSNLCDAELVDSAGTWYSEKGKEMTVYAVTAERIVFQFGVSSRSTAQPPEAKR